MDVLLGGVADGPIGTCLCDERDYLRFANTAFREAFIPDAPRGEPVEFTQAIVGSIFQGRGIKLESLTPDQFLTHIREVRRKVTNRSDFAVDLSDGRWFWVSDCRLPNGWMMSTTTEISRMKGDELRLKQDHARALEAARTDFLTGLPNRRYGVEHAEAALNLARDTGAPLALAMLDIDNFKAINDRYGHDVGDRVLVHFAHLAGERLGPRDQISRIGGEEFLLTLPGATPRQAASLVDRLLDMQSFTTGRSPVPYTVSAGVAAAVGSASLQDVLDRADAALYRAKANGRARVELSSAA